MWWIYIKRFRFYTQSNWWGIGKKWVGDRFKVYLFNAKLDATTLVQKHKVVALRGNGTLRADPRVSSSAEDVARGIFFFFFLFTFPLSNGRSRSREDRQKDAKETLRSLTGDATVRMAGAGAGGGEGHELEEPRSPSYEKNSQMLSTHIINQAYTSERRASWRPSKK